MSGLQATSPLVLCMILGFSGIVAKVEFNSHGYYIDTPQWNTFPHTTRSARSTIECLAFCARKHTPCNSWIFDPVTSTCYFKDIQPFFRDPWPGDDGVRIVGFSKFTDLDHPFNMTITEEPYVDQGSPFTLTCTLHSGGPNTTIIWRQDGNLLNDVITSLATGGYPNVFLTSTLTYQFVTPYTSVFTCTAVIASFELNSASTTVDLRVEPNSVKVSKKCHVSRSVSITCNVAAGNPVPDVSWTKNGAKLTSGITTTPGATNVVSTLTHYEGGKNAYNVFKCFAVLAGKRNISAEARGFTENTKRIELVQTINNADGSFECRVKEGFNLGKGGSENFDMRGRRDGGRLYRFEVKKGPIYTTGVRLCFVNSGCEFRGGSLGSMHGMSLAADEWITRIRVLEGYYIFPHVLFDWSRQVDVWTNKGNHLGVGHGKGKVHEAHRPRCKLAYVSGMTGAALDFLNAVWEC